MYSLSRSRYDSTWLIDTWLRESIFVRPCLYQLRVHVVDMTAQSNTWSIHFYSPLRACTFTRTRIYSLSLIHIHANTRTRTHARAHTHTHTHTHAPTYLRSRSHTQHTKSKHASMYAYAHMHAHVLQKTSCNPPLSRDTAPYMNIRSKIPSVAETCRLSVSTPSSECWRVLRSVAEWCSVLQCVEIPSVSETCRSSASTPSSRASFTSIGHEPSA